MIPLASRSNDFVLSNRGGMFASRREAIRVLRFVLSVALTLSFISAVSSEHSTHPQRPNIVLLIDESTDGRTYRPSFKAIDLVNIRRLFQDSTTPKRSRKDTTGSNDDPRTTAETSSTTSRPYSVQFDTHYVTTPVCAASRASIWSGKYPHRIPHLQANTGMEVQGVWNNFEGLPANYSDKIQDVLKRSGDYRVQIGGKKDWVTGGHSLSNRVMAWTIYTYFPYNTTDHQAGFNNGGHEMCTGNGTVHSIDYPSKSGYYSKDWKVVNETTAWIRERGMEQVLALEKGKTTSPFFVYQGMNIVHPAYVTSSYWYNRVNQSAVTVPAWKDLHDLHPCDFQSTMLKGCLPLNASQAPLVYSLERRKRIRTIYYAMILEFDSMVGAYLDAIESVPGLAENTVVIVTSDHGDMNMEHQQFYKEVAYDASSRVPLIIKVPKNFQKMDQMNSSDHEFLTSRKGTESFPVDPIVTQPTSHVDLFPTIMDLAGIPESLRPKDLDGESLMPFLVPARRSLETSQRLQNRTEQKQGTTSAIAVKSTPLPRKRPFAVNQFHGADVAMSWFSIVDENHYKYTVFGTGDQHEPQLFDLKNDPDETNNLATIPDFESTIRRLDGLLLSVVNYRQVALEVAEYAHTSLATWVNTTSDWKTIVQNLGWRESFAKDPNASIKAIEAYLEGPPVVYECRSEQVWPPSAIVSKSKSTS